MELAAGDMRFDVPLDNACLEERTTLCADAQPGHGRVVRCLQTKCDAAIISCGRLAGRVPQDPSARTRLGVCRAAGPLIDLMMVMMGSVGAGTSAAVQQHRICLPPIN